MSYGDALQYGNGQSDATVSSCCRAPARIETEYGGLVTSAIECTACGFACRMVPDMPVDSDQPIS